MIKKKQPFTLFSVVAENLGNNELGLKTKKYLEPQDMLEDFLLSSNDEKDFAKNVLEFLNTAKKSDASRLRDYLEKEDISLEKYFRDYRFPIDTSRKPFPQTHNCKKDLTEILYDYKSLYIDLNSFKDEFQKKLLNIERRLYKLMEDH